MGSQLEVGVVAGAHGLRGAVRIRLYDPNSDALTIGRWVELVRGESSLGRFEVRSAAPVPGDTGRVRVELAGVGDRDAAEMLRGAAVKIEREALTALAPDEFYVADTIGRRVIDGAGRELGTVVGVTSNGAQDLLEIRFRDRRGRAQTWLLPVLPVYIRDVDTTGVRVELPDGMLPEELIGPDDAP